MKKLYITCVLLLMFIGFGCGRKGIKGTVKDQFGNGIEGVTVYIVNSAFLATTDENGNYFIDYVPGTFSIKFIKQGYTTCKLDLSIQQKLLFPAKAMVLHPVPDEILIAQLSSSNDLDVKLDAISSLAHRKNPTINKPKIIDWLVTNSVNLLDGDANWIDHEKAWRFYNLLKEFDDTLIIESLVRHLFLPSRLRALFLAVKLGIAGSEERLICALMEYGDKNMCEDFLNSGSEELSEGGKRWANEHGYSIMSGMGSHHVSWGHF